MKHPVIKTLIVDDEPLARDNIRILLENDPEILIEAEARNGLEAGAILRDRNIDLLFLDIQMPELNGFELLSGLKNKRMPVVIFVTAYDKYALNAFKVHALDYLLKPYSDESFYEAVNNAKEIIKLRNTSRLNEQITSLLDEYSTGAGKKYIQRIAISLNNKTIFIKTDEIDWIESADYYVQIHTGTKTNLLRETMNGLEEQLDPEKFMRIHRCTIVNIDKIKEIESMFNGDYMVTLSSGTKLKLSKSRKKLLRQKLNINNDRPL